MHTFYPESYFQKLNDYLAWQTERIRMLETRLNQLAQEVETLKSQRAVHIDRIEYNFDQLKVDTLEGTLNVGLSPAGLGDKSLDDLSVGGQLIRTNTAKSEAYARIYAAVDEYLNTQGPEELEQFENQYQIQLGDSFRKLMIEDLRRQIGERIKYYMQHLIDPNQMELTQEQEQGITARVKADIREGMVAYIRNKKANGDELNGLTSNQ
ncbi:spore germination protein GerPC [Paenibacillus allorhizosphaerae]|uniref:Spore germination protein GerPC n=1 Tax=Paenibacillus allorhizosphaerae TaxID=2849866 RepID=A0ABN7THW0_9BACL|nr:spore germination protein GerPC [Paenibacillus allorhizosphaerae]CAG7621746.1 putative spore germination protein GerPC [Paenibacillus allorhizosphaerae]